MSPVQRVSGQSRGGLIMTSSNAVPCEHCQKVLHRHNALEYLYCGHHQVVAFRLRDGRIESIPVNSTEEAIELVQESGQESRPLKIPA